MNSLKSLTFLTVGAILVSVTFALATKDRTSRISIDSDDGHSIQHIVNGDRGEFLLRDDNRRLRAKWDGEFDITDDGTGIARLEDELEIELTEDDEKHRVEFQDDDGDIKAALYIDGEKQEASDETTAEISRLLLHFLRASGLKADERVASLLSSGGPEAALAEMRLLEGDHAKARYAIAVSEKADLNDAQILELIEIIKPIDSDHDLSRAIRSILEHESISPEITPALIGAASGIESDHDMRKIVEAFAERPLTPAAMDIALSLYENIDSDHDLRVSAQALLENKALDDASAARMLSVAATEIDSNHDMRLILTESAARFAKGGDFAKAWLAGLDEIDSSHDQRTAIVEVAELGELDSEAWAALIGATGAIDSSHDQRVALIAILDNFDPTPELVSACRDAAARIDSDHDREKVEERVAEIAGN